MTQQTAVEWLLKKIENKNGKEFSSYYTEFIEQAKEMEKEQRGYTEEQAYEIWKAGQKYWETSGSSITFEELIEKFKPKSILQRNL
jgi:hypothetical protein